jgi:glycosyltransferase involved in cell wall biosynthesis
MKVVMANKSVYPSHPYGGAEKYMFYLGTELAKKGVEVEFVASRPESGQTRSRHNDIGYVFLPPGIVWNHYYPLASSLGHLVFSANLARYLRGQTFDVLHGYGMVSYFYLRSGRRRPVVLQPFEEAYEPQMPRTRGRDLSWPLRRWLVSAGKKHFYQHCLTHADKVAVEGEFQTRVLERVFRIPGDKCFVLPVGVHISKIREVLARAEAVSRGELGLSADDFVLMSVNRLEKVKGVHYLVEAFRKVRREATNAKLILVGSGPEEESIRAQVVGAGLSGSVLQFSEVPEDRLYEFYALSDLYVSPTLGTGSVMSVIEAMACGLPVVSTGQDFWVKTGENGFVVAKKNPEAMAVAILETWADNDRRRSFSEASRRIAHQYDFPVIADAAISQYQRLAESRLEGSRTLGKG